jgi:WD40 repeat protein
MGRLIGSQMASPPLRAPEARHMIAQGKREVCRERQTSASPWVKKGKENSAGAGSCVRKNRDSRTGALRATLVCSLIALSPGIAAQPAELTEIQSIPLGDHCMVRALALSPDGDRLLCGAFDGRIFVLDPASGGGPQWLGNHIESVNAVAFAPDGQHAVSTGQGFNQIQIWDLNAEEQVRHLGAHTGWVTDVQFSPDGQWLVSAGGDTVRVWDWRTGEERHCYQQGPRFPSTAAFSPDSQGLAMVSGGQVQIRGVASGEMESQ